MRRIAKITGRSDDMLIIRGVNVFPSQIEEQILRLEPLAPHYEIIVTRPDRLDVVELRIEPREGVDQDDAIRAARELGHNIKTMIGISTKVELSAPGSLQRFEGKASRTVDLRPKN